MKEKPNKRITVASAKAKGRRVQKKVVRAIRRKFHLPGEDVESTPMGVPGIDVKLSNRARQVFPYAVECKGISKFAGYKIYEQAERHAKDNPELKPLAVVHGDYKKTTLVMLSLEHFMELLNA